MKKRPLELLAPAKNYEQGCEAVNHGADALYVGPPSFGARVAAGNSMSDIERLVQYAHLFHSKVFVTVNTILYDDELEPATKMIHQLYNAGVDAILIQDMGLLQCDLPPIELHASTQTHNASVERVSFLQHAGFKRVVLARETSIEQMRQIRAATNVELEGFVQGALCVCYSGQCYMSEYLTHRSGNRGCCSQPCRSSYNLLNASGEVLQRGRHLLSLKDFSAAQQIEAMADAGIMSFKIEGRLKDMSYVKNVTAYYRKLLDALLERREEYCPSSSGRCTYMFEPDLSRTFNRGFTDYFLRERQPMASFATQKSVGKEIGTCIEVSRRGVTVSSREQIVPGDGICYENGGEMFGFRVNRVVGNVLIPSDPSFLTGKNNSLPLKGTTLYRNNDFAFEKSLQGKSAQRKIGVSLLFSETKNGFTLRVTDEDGVSVESVLECDKILANNIEGAYSQIQKQLSKMGDTVFSVIDFTDATTAAYFLPAATLNDLRRRAVASLEQHRLENAKPTPYIRNDDGKGRVSPKIDYSYNVVNKKSEKFYKEHGATTVEHGLEETHDFKNKVLMTTKFCLRYELGQCLQHKCNQTVDSKYRQDLYLHNNNHHFHLVFDCANCQMKIYAEE